MQPQERGTARYHFEGIVKRAAVQESKGRLFRVQFKEEEFLVSLRIVEDLFDCAIVRADVFDN